MGDLSFKFELLIFIQLFSNNSLIFYIHNVLHVRKTTKSQNMEPTLRLQCIVFVPMALTVIVH